MSVILDFCARQTDAVPEPLPELAAPQPSAAETSLALESGADALVTEIECLQRALSATENDLRVALAATLRERAQVLDLIGAQERPEMVFEQGETALAQAVLAAQMRVESSAEAPTPPAATQRRFLVRA